MRKTYNNPFNCPVTRTVEYIGGRWKPIIIFLLIDKPLRFGKLAMFMPTISKKILTQQLRELEKDELVIRHVFKEIPLRVEYELSERGKSLLPLMMAMKEWGNTMLMLEPA
ncbi:MAG TPA: helix-turn-helix domain-containing protein [Chitinophaga sp.]